MSASELWPPPGGFQDRLEAELVKVVTARAAVSRHPGKRVVARRRPVVRAGLLAAGAALAAAAGAGFGGLAHGYRQAAPAQAEVSAGGGPVHIRTAAFTLDASSGGSIRVTVDKSRYIQDGRDIASLQQALREAGFPVLIKQGVFCTGPREDGRLGAGGVGPGVRRVMTGADKPGGVVVFTFSPAAMPAGEELFIGYLSAAQLAITHGHPGSVERLVPAGVPLTCTSALPFPG